MEYHSASQPVLRALSFQLCRVAEFCQWREVVLMMLLAVRIVSRFYRFLKLIRIDIRMWRRKFDLKYPCCVPRLIISRRMRHEGFAGTLAERSVPLTQHSLFQFNSDITRVTST
ncbi:hypothetical protein B6D51_28490 [Pseudomonas chlororaphis subsp. chlororaphis]|nr:hypothetical protein B6D51_28490 [Pseudomonas chlororaphis subsp. chlororaphis]